MQTLAIQPTCPDCYRSKRMLGDTPFDQKAYRHHAIDARVRLRSNEHRVRRYLLCFSCQESEAAVKLGSNTNRVSW